LKEAAVYYSPTGNAEVWVIGEQPEGYITVEEWEAAHPPSPEQVKASRIAEIYDQLDSLDKKSVRPLRAITAGTGTEDDTSKLQDIEMTTSNLRTELAELTAPEPETLKPTRSRKKPAAAAPVEE